jgi:hypothetical protein
MAEDRLDSWKEIAAYLRRDVTTVQRWEKREGMPVHRHQHDRLGSVYAYRHELDAWSMERRPSGAEPADSAVAEPEPEAASSRRIPAWVLAVAVLVIAAGVVGVVPWRRWSGGAVGQVLFAARFQPLTNSGGISKRRSAFPRWPVCGLSLRSRRTHGRVGHADRHRAVLQPDG